MTPVERSVSEDDLHAYVDGFLNRDDRLRVERYLDENPEAAARIAGWQNACDQLKLGLSHKAKEPVPSRLNLQHLAQSRAARAWRPMNVAASIAMALIVGSGAGWVARGTDAPHGLNGLAQQAAVAQRVFVADQGSRGFDPKMLTERVGWSGRFGREISAPDLSQAGYKLVGGRLVATEQGSAPMFTYENAKGEKICMFVRLMVGTDENASMRPVAVDGLSGYTWSHDGVGFGLFSEKHDPKLHDLSNEVEKATQFGA